jgi:hypothetical protein
MKKNLIALLFSTFLVQNYAKAQTPQLTAAATIVLEGVGIVSAPVWLIPTLLTAGGIAAVSGIVYAACPGKNFQEKSAFLKKQTHYLIAQGVFVVACSTQLLSPPGGYSFSNPSHSNFLPKSWITPSHRDEPILSARPTTVTTSEIDHPASHFIYVQVPAPFLPNQFPGEVDDSISSSYVFWSELTKDEEEVVEILKKWVNSGVFEFVITTGNQEVIEKFLRAFSLLPEKEYLIVACFTLEAVKRKLRSKASESEIKQAVDEVFEEIEETRGPKFTKSFKGAIASNDGIYDRLAPHLGLK